MAKPVSDKSLRKRIKAILARELFALRPEVPSNNQERGSASDSKQSSQFARAVLASGAVAIVLDAIWSYFAVAGIVHMGAARVILVFAWIVGTTGIVVSDYLWGKPFLHRLRLGIIASALLGLM